MSDIFSLKGSPAKFTGTQQHTTAPERRYHFEGSFSTLQRDAFPHNTSDAMASYKIEELSTTRRMSSSDAKTHGITTAADDERQINNLR